MTTNADDKDNGGGGDAPKDTKEAIAAEASALDAILPHYDIADLRHLLLLPDELSPNKENVKKKLMDRIENNAMLSYYKSCCEALGWTPDEALIERMESANAEELKALEAKIADAEENYGDSEVRDSLLLRAHFYCRIGDKDKAVAEYQIVFDRTIGAGGKLDTLLTLIRLGLFHRDVELVKKNLHHAKEELEKRGDWERRNKLKVYEGVQLMTSRGFKEAAELFLDSIATFTATELVSFESFIFYTVVMSMIALDRPILREKVVNSPEVLQVVQEDEALKEFMVSYYSCRYLDFMKNLIPIAERVRRDRYLGKHYRYFIRNIRLRAYVQFLEPFKSVTLQSMSLAFGVSKDFIEEEVASFIASGKLSCKIDKVNGVIESNRPDARNRLYLQTIKQGDLLLNRIQKLSRVIDM